MVIIIPPTSHAVSILNILTYNCISTTINCNSCITWILLIPKNNNSDRCFVVLEIKMMHIRLPKLLNSSSHLLHCWFFTVKQIFSNKRIIIGNRLLWSSFLPLLHGKKIPLSKCVFFSYNELCSNRIVAQVPEMQYHKSCMVLILVISISSKEYMPQKLNALKSITTAELQKNVLAEACLVTFHLSTFKKACCKLFPLRKTIPLRRKQHNWTVLLLVLSKIPKQLLRELLRFWHFN